MFSSTMHCILITLFAVLFHTQDASRRDEQEIRAVIQRYLDAREHRDPKAVAEVFTRDADQLVSSGEWRRGRDALVRGTLASSESTGGHRSITINTIRFLAPTVAIADGRYEVTALAGGQDRKMWTTFLLTRTSGSWRISAIRNMLPAAPAGRK